MQNNNNNPPLILVTGASGFLASHLIKLLLERGFKVRGTVRSLANKESYEFLYTLVPEKKENLEIVEAVLNEGSGWSSSVEGCEYVFHVASPTPKNTSTSDENFIEDAVNGTKYVLETSLEKGVKKVVVTSCAATIRFGTKKKIVSEDDWSDEAACNAFALSKVRAERFALDFYEQNKDRIKVAIINPALVVGPTLTKADSISTSLVGEILKGGSSGVIDLEVGVVDVRDVVEAHFQAMFRDEANGKRCLTSGTDMHWKDLIRILKGEFGRKGFTIQDRLVSKEEVVEKGSTLEKALSPLIGSDVRIDNGRSVRELGMTYRPLEETIIDAANSLIKIGIVPKPQTV